MLPQAYATFAMGPPQVRSSLRIELLTDLLIYIDVYYCVCNAMFTNSQPLGFAPL